MVRVGGGWADLGEYLKEYASHHGRRGVVEVDDKVEIQDLPFRSVSGTSVSGAGVAGRNASGRDTPMMGVRASSALNRPSSSLAVRKARKSMNDTTLDLPSPLPHHRTPSTPLPSSLSRSTTSDTNTFSTPPNSIPQDRSSSRLSWIEDPAAASLGLAGPKGKKVELEERDQEWVESIKEKVRLASAEKNREREKERRRTASGVVGGEGIGGDRSGKEKGNGRRRETSFGELDVVNGTKRVFVKKS